MTKAQRAEKAAQRAKADHQLFMRRSLAAYHNLSKRCGQPPFTLEELRSKIRLGVDSACPYCGGPVKLKTFSVDHDIPLKRGGSSMLHNLTVCDAACNTSKGSLTGWEFTQLLGFLSVLLDAPGKREFLGRLKAGGSAARMGLWRKGK